MTHNFEIKVQCKGNAVGTLNWLNSLLEDGELVIKNTKGGGSSMFLHNKTKFDGTPTLDTESNTFICKVIVQRDYIEEYRVKRLSVDNVLVYAYPVTGYQGEHGIVDCPLTPAALIKMEEFIEKATGQFVEWWNEQ